MKKLLALFAVLLMLLAGYAIFQSAGTSETPAQNAIGGAVNLTVAISGFAFQPAAITVARGATVTWTNNDAAPHTVTSDSFDSGTLAQDQSYSRTFTQSGIYTYICSIHPSMKGTVTVAAS